MTELWGKNSNGILMWLPHMSFLKSSPLKVPVWVALLFAKSDLPLYLIQGLVSFCFCSHFFFLFQLRKSMFYIQCFWQFHSSRAISHQYLAFSRNCICIYFLFVQSKIPSSTEPGLSASNSLQCLLDSCQGAIDQPTGSNYKSSGGGHFYVTACNNLEEKLHSWFHIPSLKFLFLSKSCWKKCIKAVCFVFMPLTLEQSWDKRSWKNYTHSRERDYA